jgi:NADH dehydrogenase (ubiquinone) 1 alpha subcomplex subunit 1
MVRPAWTHYDPLDGRGAESFERRRPDEGDAASSCARAHRACRRICTRSAPRAALTTHAFPPRRRAVVARNQSQPFESFPPFAIIVGAITAMGGVQYLVHHAYEGKPKPVGADNFDRLLKYRDIRLKDEAKVRFRRRRREANPKRAPKGFFFFFFALLRGAAEPDDPRSRRFV